MTAAETETRPAPPSGEVGEYIHFYCKICNPGTVKDWGVFITAVCGTEVLVADLLDQVQIVMGGGTIDLDHCAECARQYAIHPDRCDAHAGKR